MDPQHEPIACSLSPTDSQGQVDGWSDLVAAAVAVERVADGVRITAPLDWADRASDVATQEASCCAFLTITTTTAADSVVVTITSPDPDAQFVARLLAGLESAPTP